MPDRCGRQPRPAQRRRWRVCRAVLPPRPAGGAPAAPWALLLATSPWLLSCAEQPAEPPPAVVTAEPESVCYLDDFATPVTLDASGSAPSLTLVPAEVPEEGWSLVYDWVLSGAAHVELDRDPSDVWLQITTAGDRPLHVELTVHNDVGGEATTLFTLPITLPDPPRDCSDKGCPVDFECVAVAGGQWCAPARICESDDECPACLHCEEDVQRCFPDGVGE